MGESTIRRLRQYRAMRTVLQYELPDDQGETELVANEAHEWIVGCLDAGTDEVQITLKRVDRWHTWNLSVRANGLELDTDDAEPG